MLSQAREGVGAGSQARITRLQTILGRLPLRPLLPCWGLSVLLAGHAGQRDQPWASLSFQSPSTSWNRAPGGPGGAGSVQVWGPR